MSVTVKWVMEALETLAPVSLAEKWDNPGLLIGDEQQEVSTVLVALDAIYPVIEEAICCNAQLIVTHHPILFHAIKKITKQTPLGKRLYRLIENNISVYASHTNLDIADGGTNDTLAALIGLEEINGWGEFKENNGIGRIGKLPNEISFYEFASKTKEILGLDSMRLVGDTEKKVKTIALCTGSGAEFIPQAIALEADVYITSDLKYHEAQMAIEQGLCMIDATHYQSEVFIVPVLRHYLLEYAKKQGKQLEVIVSKVNGQTFSCI